MNDKKDESKDLKINVDDKIKVSEDISTSTSVLSVSASGFDDIDRVAGRVAGRSLIC